MRVMDQVASGRGASPQRLRRKLVPEAAIVLVVSDNLAPAGVAPTGRSPACLRPKFFRQVSTETVFGEGVLRDLFVACEGDLGMTQGNAPPKSPNSRVNDGSDDRFAQARCTFPAWLRICIIERAEKLHQASRLIDVGLDFAHSISRCSVRRRIRSWSMRNATVSAAIRAVLDDRGWTFDEERNLSTCSIWP